MVNSLLNFGGWSGSKKKNAETLLPSDGQEGWVTVAGNLGTIFLQEGGHLWKVR